MTKKKNNIMGVEVQMKKCMSKGSCNDKLVTLSIRGDRLDVIQDNMNTISCQIDRYRKIQKILDISTKENHFILRSFLYRLKVIQKELFDLQRTMQFDYISSTDIPPIPPIDLISSSEVHDTHID